MAAANVKRGGAAGHFPREGLTAYLEGRLQLEQDRLREEDLARLQTQPADLELRQLHILAGLQAANCKCERGQDQPSLINVRGKTGRGRGGGGQGAPTFEEAGDDAVDVELVLLHGGWGWGRRATGLDGRLCGERAPHPGERRRRWKPMTGKRLPRRAGAGATAAALLPTAATRP